MENINPQNWPRPDNLNQQSSGTPPPPPPPPPEITLRTMQSDIETMKQSGGEEPVARPFTPPELKKEEKVDLSGFSKESKEEISPEMAPESPPKSSKWILWVVLIIVILGGFTALGYYLVFPALFPSEVETPVTTPPPQTPAVIPPAAAPVVPAATTTATTTPAGVLIPEAPVLKPHVSLFAIAADSQVKLSAAAPLAFDSVKQVLVGEANNKPTAETAVKEIIFSGDNGQLNFTEVFPLFLTDFAATTLSNYFEEDFTGFIYYDKNGQWFGLAAKLKSGADITAAKTEMAKLEQSAGLANLYLVSPGAKSSAGFKTGQVGAMATRYIAFSKAGASLNYGWTSNNLFVISTSYNSLKAVAPKLIP